MQIRVCRRYASSNASLDMGAGISIGETFVHDTSMTAGRMPSMQSFGGISRFFCCRIKRPLHTYRPISARRRSLSTKGYMRLHVNQQAAGSSCPKLAASTL